MLNSRIAVNDEFERICKWSWPSEVLYQRLCEGTEKNLKRKKKLSQDNQFPG
jgi:capsid portal protein